MYDYSIVIPTHNRHDYMRRSIEYFKEFEATIIYCDSSPKSYVGDLPDNALYLHCPDMSFSGKVIACLETVQSKFVAFCADDDFLLEGPLKKGHEILASSGLLKAAIGNYGGFEPNFDGRFHPLYPKRAFEMIQGGWEETTERFFSDYHIILWGLFEKNTALEAYRLVRDAQVKNDNFIELILGAFCCASGGIVILDELWGVRELNVGDRWGARHKSIALLQGDDGFQKEFSRVEALLDERLHSGLAEKVLKYYLAFCSKRSLKGKSPLTVLSNAIRWRCQRIKRFPGWRHSLQLNREALARIVKVLN